MCLAATHSACKAITAESIDGVCRGVKSLIFVELPDAAKYVRKCTTVRCIRSPSNCFMPQTTCAVHRLHRIVVNSVDEDEAIGDTHAISFVAHQNQKRSDIRSAKDQLVREELIVIHGPPPAINLEQLDRVLDHTIGRREGIVRGRLVYGQSLAEPRRKAARTMDRRTKCLMLKIYKQN